MINVLSSVQYRTRYKPSRLRRSGMHQTVLPGCLANNTYLHSFFSSACWRRVIVCTCMCVRACVCACVYTWWCSCVCCSFRTSYMSIRQARDVSRLGSTFKPDAKVCIEGTYCSYEGIAHNFFPMEQVFGCTVSPTRPAGVVA